MAQRIAATRDLVQIKWGSVSDLPMISLGDQGNNPKYPKNWTTVKVARILDWSGQIGQFRLTLQLDNGKVSTIRGCGVVLALDCDAFPLKIFKSIKTQSVHALACQLGVDLLGFGKPQGTGIFDRSSKIAFLLRNGGIEALVSTALVLKCALELKTRFGCSVQVFHGEMAVAGGQLEKMYQEARQIGVGFYRYKEPPQEIDRDGIIKLRYRDPFLPQHFPEIEVPVDLVVVTEEYLPSKEMQEISGLAGLSLGPEGFLAANDSRYWSGRTNRQGIYGIGLMRGPGRILDLLDELEEVKVDLIHHLAYPKQTWAAKVDPLLCEVCLTCYRVCPARAVELRTDKERVESHKLYQQVAWIDSWACQGCGICIAECPAQAINWQDPLLFTKLPDLSLILLADASLYQETAVAEDFKDNYKDDSKDSLKNNLKDNSKDNKLFKPPINLVALACTHSGFQAAKDLGSTLKNYDCWLPQEIKTKIRVQAVSCAGQIDGLMILKILEGGADGILIWSCHPEACNHSLGQARAKRRLEITKNYLQEIGLSERVALVPVAGQSYFQLVDSIKKLASQISEVTNLKNIRG
jgi:coenzyme F420-reducing hydrogenase delta subunit/formate hydrogenlyase subunit 6/NADH:ubiquinone oxidoreductase subunit I